MKNDEDAPCDICRSKESEPSNEMVFCDLCDVCVHQACYGVTDIPEGQWFCKPCEQNIRPKCIFCPSKKGAMKKTKSGNWAHVSCAIWIPEVSFGVPETMDNIVNTENIPKTRWNLTCSLCHVRGGACIQCYVKKCLTAYHVTCAFEFKLYMEMQEVDDSEQDIKFESFCLTHTSIRATGQNPHLISGSSKKRKKDQENQKSNENKNTTQFSKTEAPLEENCASTSHNSDIPVISASETTIEKSGNNLQNMNNGGQIGAGLVTDQALTKNLATISKATARKSFALPPKLVKKSLSKTLPKQNGKVVRNSNGQSKRPSVQNKVSGGPKKSKTKSSTNKTKNSSTKFAPLVEGKNPTQSGQPSTESQFSGTPHKRPCPMPNRQSSAEVKTENDQHLTESGTPQEQMNSNHVNDLSPSASNVQFLPCSVNQNGQGPLFNFAVGAQANPMLRAIPKNDNLDDFSRYVVSLLRNLPYKKSLKVQKKIISLVLKEHDVSSEEEFDVLSISSDESCSIQMHLT